MASQKKHVGLALGIGLILAAVRSMIVYNLMEVNAYEKKTYYLPDCFSVNIFSTVCVALLLVFVLLAIKEGKGKGFVPENKCNAASPASCILAFMLLGAVVIYVFSLVEKDMDPTFLGMGILLFSVASAVWFLINGLRVVQNKTAAVMALMPVFLMIFRLLGDFLRTNATPLASSGGYHIMGLVAALIYFLCEGKNFAIGGSAAIYLCSGYLSIVLLLVYALPNVILHCFGVFSFDYYAGYSAVDFCIAIYIWARMINIKFVGADE